MMVTLTLHQRAKKCYVRKDVCAKRVCVYLYTDICEENTMLTPVISGICDYTWFFSIVFIFRDFLWGPYTLLITENVIKSTVLYTI